MSKLPNCRFNLRLPNSKSETLISLVYRYKGRRIVYSTGFSIHPKDWNFKAQRPIARERRPDLFSIRRHLDDLANYCTSIFIEADYGSISVEEFKSRLDVLTGVTDVQEEEQEETRPTLVEFLYTELQEMKTEGFRWDTWRMYQRHVNMLIRFGEEVGPYDYEDVDWNFRLVLIDWLAKQNFKLAYGNKTLSVLRQFLERARRKNLHSNTLYQGSGWMVPQKKAKGQKVTLSPDELQILADLKLFGIADRVRDLFLIGAGTGQRFSDYSKFVPDNFYKTINNIPIVSVISQKTATPAKIPLNIFPWLIPILEKWNYSSPKVCMQNLNEKIKDICQKAGFKENVFIVGQLIGRKAAVEKTYVPKYTMVSSHTCRRSFATNLYRMGYRLAQIMPMTGHSTETQLREYIGIDNEMNAEEIAFSIMEGRQNLHNTSRGKLKVANG